MNVDINPTYWQVEVVDDGFRVTTAAAQGPQGPTGPAGPGSSPGGSVGAIQVHGAGDVFDGHGVVTPSTITSNQAAYNPGVGLIQRWSSDTTRFIQGMVAGFSGEVRFVTNVGSQPIVILSEDGAATAANRFSFMTSSAYLGSGAVAVVVYDGTAQRWRVGVLWSGDRNVGTNAALDMQATTVVLWTVAGALRVSFSDKGVNLPGTNAGEGEIAWTDAAFPTTGTRDTSLRRGGAAGVVGLSRGATDAGATLRSIPLTPSQITSNQNNYAPGVAMFYRLSTDSSRDITGLSVGQVAGQVCEIWNVGAQNIVLKHQDTNSTDVNRFLNVTGADITLAANEIALLRYDATTQRWRVGKV